MSDSRSITPYLVGLGSLAVFSVGMSLSEDFFARDTNSKISLVKVAKWTTCAVAFIAPLVGVSAGACILGSFHGRQ